MVLFWILIALLIGYRMGWESAHKTVASECRKLGRFYVGKTVFHCPVVEDTSAPGYQPKGPLTSQPPREE